MRRAKFQAFDASTLFHSGFGYVEGVTHGSTARDDDAVRRLGRADWPGHGAIQLFATGVRSFSASCAPL